MAELLYNDLLSQLSDQEKDQFQGIFGSKGWLGNYQDNPNASVVTGHDNYAKFKPIADAAAQSKTLNKFNWSSLLGMGSADAAEPTHAERAAMLAGNNSGIMGAYRPNMRDISGEVGEYNNIGNIRLNEMERIIANKEFEEQPGIHFDNAPIENIFNRQNDPTKGVIDRNFRYKELNNPEGINYDKRGFSLSGILQGLKNQFQRPEGKQAAYEAIMGDRKPLGLWNTQSGNYGGNKYTLQRSPTGLKVYSEVNPYGKNFDSAFGSKSLEEMDEKTLAWAMDRLSKGKNISSRLTGILENRGRLDGSPGDGGGATRWQPDYEGAVAHQQQMAAKAGQTHEQFMSDLNEVRAKGGRVGYNEGGRVGILSVF